MSRRALPSFALALAACASDPPPPPPPPAPPATEPDCSVDREALRANDVLRSINGRPIAAARDDARALHEALRGARRFALLVDRGGQPLVLSFFVD